MAEPVLGAVAAAAELTALAQGGIKSIVKRQPEYHHFWEHFERQLAPEFRDLPWDKLETFRVDPAFVGLACRLIRGEREALNQLEELFEQKLEPPDGGRHDKEGVVRAALAAARESASEAVKDFKAASRQQVGLLEGRIERAEGAISNEVQTGTREVVHGQELLAKQVGSLHGRLNDLERELQKRPAAPVTADRAPGGQSAEARPLPELSERGDDFRTPEELVAALEVEDPEGGRRLHGLLADNGPAAVVAMIRTRDHPAPDDSLPFLITTARIAGRSGAFPEAEEAYLWASQLPGLSDAVRARQVVRAAGMGQLGSGEARFRVLIEEAKKLDPQHPSVAIAEARSSKDAEWMLERVAEVLPETDAEAALLHVTRAQAHLAMDREDEAAGELELAKEANAESIAVREFESILPLVGAQRQLGRGERPNQASLRRAADGLQALRSELERQGRYDESASLAARAAEAYALADDQDAAVVVLESIKRADRLSRAARVDAGQSALVTRRPDLVLRFVPADDERPEARLLRADALTCGDDPAARRGAVEVLETFLDGNDGEIRRHAAFARLAAAASDAAVDWHDRAAELVREIQPFSAAILRAEHLQLHGDSGGAEQELLPHADRPQVLRLLRDYAARAAEWAKAKDRSRSLIRAGPTDHDRLVHAQILREVGEIDSAREAFRAVARDEAAADDLRDSAFSAIAPLVGDGRNYPAVKEVAEEWRDSLPASRNAVWNLAFALARTSEHPEAYRLLETTQAEPETLQQAQLTAEIFYRAARRTAAVRRIEELSSRFGQAEELEAPLIVTYLELDEETRGELPADLAVEVQQRFESFSDRFPESKALWRLDAPGSAEEFDALMREMHAESAEWQRRIQDEVVAGQAPINALAVVSPVSQVGSAWGKMGALPLGFSIPVLDEHERTVAANAVGGAAVWEPSSICVVGGLGEELEQRVRTALPGSLIVQDTLDDADAAASAVTATKPPTATAGYDPETGHAFIREISPEESEIDRRRTEGMLRLAKELEVEAAVGEDSDERLVTVLEDDGVDRAWKPFVGTLLLAQQSKRPIFSDDRWIRQFAREHGVESFGTVSLLDALADQGVISAEGRTAARRRLAASGGWGLALTGDEMIETARVSEWYLTATAAGMLRDRAAWRGGPGERFREMVVFLQACFDEARERFGVWVRRVLDAAQEAMPHMEKSWSAQSLLILAWGLHESDRVTSDACFHGLVDEIQQLPPGMRSLGFDPVLRAMDGILRQFNDQPDELRLAVLTMMLRRLRFPDHPRAWETFVAPPQPGL